jgi:hypothetical protein
MNNNETEVASVALKRFDCPNDYEFTNLSKLE